MIVILNNLAQVRTRKKLLTKAPAGGLEQLVVLNKDAVNFRKKSKSNAPFGNLATSGFRQKDNIDELFWQIPSQLESS